jgi:hypothetical protein
MVNLETLDGLLEGEEGGSGRTSFGGGHSGRGVAVSGDSRRHGARASAVAGREPRTKRWRSK